MGRQILSIGMQVLRARQTFRLEHASMREQQLVPGGGQLLDDGTPYEPGAPEDNDSQDAR